MRVLVLLLCILGPIVLVLNLRGMDKLLSNPKMGKTLLMLADQPLHSLALFSSSFGFYLKKILLPWPLNFTITEVGSHYVWVGAILLVVSVLLFLSFRALPVRLFLSGTLFLAPAMPVSLGFIAWTSFAERYAYVALAFIVLAVMVYLGKAITVDRFLIPGFVVFTCVLMVFGASTTLRASLWADDVSFFADAVAKNPDFYRVRYAYGNVLLNDFQLLAAEKQYRQAFALQKDDAADNKFLIYMGILRTWDKRYWEAKDFFEQAVDNYTGKDLLLAYDKLAWTINKLLLTEDMAFDREPLHKDLLNVTLQLYELKKDPFLLYRAGQSALALSRKEEARHYFSEAYARLPADSMYRPLARKLMKKL